MANNTVEFRIGSKYDGEGFKQANDAIKKNRQEITSSTKGLGELANAFKQISPEAATAISGVQKFGQAFVTGGIVGGAITLAMQGISSAITYFIDKANEAKETAKKYADILKNELMTALGDNEAKFKSMSSALQDANAEIKASLALLNGETAREATNQVHKLHIETLQQITDDMSEAGKASLTAQEQLKAQQIRGEAALKALNNTLESEKQIRENANKSIEQAEAHLDQVDETYRDLENKLFPLITERANLLQKINAAETQLELGVIDENRANKKLTPLKIALAKLEEEHKEDLDKLDKSRKAVEAAEREVEKAEKNAATVSTNISEIEKKISAQKLENTAKETEAAKKVEAASAKKAEADEAAALAAWDQSQSEREAEEAAEKRKEADDHLFDSLMAQADATIAATDMAEVLANAEKDSADALKKLEEKANATASGMGGGSSKADEDFQKKMEKFFKRGQRVDVNVTWPEQMDSIPKPKKLDDETWNRFKNGLANAADMEKIARYQEREERDRQTARARQVEDSRRFLKIADMPETWRSPADNRFMETFKTQVLPRMSADQAAALLQEGGKHVMMKNDLKEFLGNQSELMRFLKELGLK